MTRVPQIRLLPDGRRLHLQDGPIDLIVQGFGGTAEVAGAYEAAARRFDGLLDELCEELRILRSPDRLPLPQGTAARRMHHAVAPFRTATFITPMAAVAGAVADEILAAMIRSAPLDRAYVNNGGDIALHCAEGQGLTVGLIDRPDRPCLFGRLTIKGDDAVRGIATSGWHGRSFSLGIADSVTVLARNAAAADAAASVIANAVDLPGHPAVRRAPANSVQVDNDLGDRLVTRAVGPLGAAEKARALAGGVRVAQGLIRRGLIVAAALHLQGETCSAGNPPSPDQCPPTPMPSIARRGARPEVVLHA